jgi:hypothetical protein
MAHKIMLLLIDHFNKAVMEIKAWYDKSKELG